MAKKTRVLLVDEKGCVTPETVPIDQKKIEKIKWLPEIEGEVITITFGVINIPFTDSSWNTGSKKGTSVSGKLKTVGSGQHEFKYSAKGWVNRKCGRGNPKLIVDGGRRKAKRQ